MTTLSRPILFKGSLVRAILAGTKTETRRLVRGGPTAADDTARVAYTVSSTVRAHRDTFSISQIDPAGDKHTFRGRESELWRGRCPYGTSGGLLWVRETWAADVPGCAEQGGYSYRADHMEPRGDGPAHPMTWRPSIFMPRDACRILLRVHAVRIERLADITADGIRAEGFEGTRAEFAAGWDTINGTRGSWASNPWVWVIKFHLEAHGPRVALDVKHGATMDVESGRETWRAGEWPT